MQKCEVDEPLGRKDVLNKILKCKLDRAEQAIREGDLEAAIALLDEASLISLEAGETEVALVFSRQASIFKARIGIQGEDTVTSTTLNARIGKEPDESNKRASMKKWLKDMLLDSMRKNMARIQKNSISQ